jgi:hypothetical protein
VSIPPLLAVETTNVVPVQCLNWPRLVFGLFPFLPPEAGKTSIKQRDLATQAETDRTRPNAGYRIDKLTRVPAAKSRSDDRGTGARGELDGEAANTATSTDDQNCFSLGERERLYGRECRDPASGATPAAAASTKAGFGAICISGLSAMNSAQLPRELWDWHGGGSRRPRRPRHSR